MNWATTKTHYIYRDRDFLRKWLKDIVINIMIYYVLRDKAFDIEEKTPHITVIVPCNTSFPEIKIDTTIRWAKYDRMIDLKPPLTASLRIEYDARAPELFSGIHMDIKTQAKIGRYPTDSFSDMIFPYDIYFFVRYGDIIEKSIAKKPKNTCPEKASVLLQFLSEMRCFGKKMSDEVRLDEIRKQIVDDWDDYIEVNLDGAMKKKYDFTEMDGSSTLISDIAPGTFIRSPVIQTNKTPRQLSDIITETLVDTEWFGVHIYGIKNNFEFFFRITIKQMDFATGKIKIELEYFDEEDIKFVYRNYGDLETIVDDLFRYISYGFAEAPKIMYLICGNDSNLRILYAAYRYLRDIVEIFKN